MTLKSLELRPIKETTEDYDAVEREIIRLFKKEIYVPLISEFYQSSKVLKNAKSDLIDAILSGRITFNRGVFSGRFNSTISKRLKELGAKWDRKGQAWKISLSSLPQEIQNTISASETRYAQKIAFIDKQLAKLVPEEFADKIQLTKLFDRSLWKVDRDFQQTVKGITIAPKLTPEQAKRIAEEWQTNMKLWITDFTKKEIIKLREDMQQSVFAGNRYESAVSKIKDSFQVMRNKAKFLARQETSLLMTKFKQTRYEDAGVNHYKWGCVSGTAAHPVRPWHRALEGKIFKWSDPPVTTKPGEPARKNNPGQDYNCRCFAIPIVKFR